MTACLHTRLSADSRVIHESGHKDSAKGVSISASLTGSIIGAVVCLAGGAFFFLAEAFFFELKATGFGFFPLRVVIAIVYVKELGANFMRSIRCMER